MSKITKIIDDITTIRYKRLTEDAKQPYKKHEWDAGFDLAAVSKKETEDYIQYGTGVAFEIPNGYVGFIVPRSSVTDMDLLLKNSIGIIDAPYRGEIKFRFYKNIVEETNRSSEVYDTHNGELIKHNFKALNYRKEESQKIYEIGDRIGQIIFIRLPSIKLEETSDELEKTERGKDGYGSTGKK